MSKKNKIFYLYKSFAIGLVVLFFSSCKPFYNTVYKKPTLVDTKTSKRVKKLHKELFYLSKEGFAIGHQDDTSYGIGWKQADFPNMIKSDVNDVVGDFPAVYGFDISGIETGNENNLDDVPFNTMRQLIIDAFSKGGIITISWHADNPVTNGDSWDKTPAVEKIIGNGIYVDKYEEWINKVATFLKSLKFKGKDIPIIFRPFHEMNGGWFWWGNPNCNSIEYIQLWRNTVYLLRDTYHIHNLVYTYSPNRLGPNDAYMDYYPGDNFVDILGIDIYDFQNSFEFVNSLEHDLKIIKNIATERSKLYALTETGVNKLDGNNWFIQDTSPDQNWFSKVLYPTIENSGIAWILFWRNGTKGEQYVSYKGHKSEADFKAFAKQPKTLFLNDINKLKSKL
ncbi:mannan endo-1,4-beta-mannosidase [Yeosuana aromativorans]|uniref:Mannan endo-1,4-beta-mannosidase n=1 Tax=Yeosuana aromativorans TaxID=288019 RepID=A0A8J3BL72_9FLAO|nr:glycosyl hydrolase [Yeosuana aromativorans]GGK22341.1 mannan endo-1,4-beta-mannosidase [Yeosuana aromativorans]